jgi:hypothetical protein
MMVRDGLLALLLTGAMVGPWHTANRLSRVIAATGACPDLWPTSGVLIGAFAARQYEESISGRALRASLIAQALPGEHHGSILATTNDSESDAIDPPAW